MPKCNMTKVLYMFDGVGMYVKGAKTKDHAVKLMRAEAEKEFAVYEKIGENWEDDYTFLPDEITNDTVKATRYFQHRKCNVETIGDDNYCIECGEPCGAGGRVCFAFIK